MQETTGKTNENTSKKKKKKTFRQQSFIIRFLLSNDPGFVVDFRTKEEDELYLKNQLQLVNKALLLHFFVNHFPSLFFSLQIVNSTILSKKKS